MATNFPDVSVSERVSVSKDDPTGPGTDACAMAALTGTFVIELSSCDRTVCGVDDVSSSIDRVPVGVDISVIIHVSKRGTEVSDEDPDSSTRGKTVADGDMV